MNRKSISRVWASLLLAVVLICGLGSHSVAAHALLQRSNPAPNAILARAPALVELDFSEALESGISSVTVLDSNAQVVDQRDVKIDPDNPAHMSVSLRSLVDGVYTVSWKAVSAADGHLTSGSFPFAVGDVQAADLSAAASEQNQIPLSTGGLAIQWLMIIALAVLAAEIPFRTLIWRPSLSAAAEHTALFEDPPAWKRLVNLGVLGLFALLGADLLVQSGQIAGDAGLPGVAAQIGRILLQTRLGLVWLLRLSLALFFGWLAVSQPAAWKPWVRFGFALALLFTLSLTSHAAAEPHPFAPVLADWLHKAAVCLWIGGLAFFIAAMHQIRPLEGIRQTRLTSLLITHFSNLALVCVGLTGFSGLYAAVLRVGSIPALTSTLYGRTLLVKLALAAVLLLLGAVNLLILSPRLKIDRLRAADNQPLVRRFRRVIQGEVLVGILVLLGASLLAELPPAVVPIKSTEQVRNIQVDDLQEELTISPARVGLNTFTLKLRSAGQPVILAKEVALRFSATLQNLPPSEVQLVSQGGGVYLAKGSYLSLPGTWQIQIIVRRENTFDAYANLNLTLQNPASGGPNQQNVRIAGGLLVMIGLGYGYLVLSLLHSRGARVGLGAAPLGMLIILGLFFFTRPTPSNQGLVNPIPPNSVSVNAGQALYTRNCAACHGLTGKGDGPAGLIMNPRPADLSLHAVPGVHTDVELFQWISQGFQGTQMPAFKSRLSESERWNLVNFIRSLAP